MVQSEMKKQKSSFIFFFVGVKKGMKSFGECIGTLVNSTFLAAVYIVGVGMTAVLAKLLGKKLIQKKQKQSNAATYWSDSDMGDMRVKNKEDYLRQF
jgi:hypothetical protein